MRVYFAGRYTGLMYPLGLRRPLLTYADRSDRAGDAFGFWIGREDAEVFLDSGAFGVHVRGTVIDLSEYCDFLEAHRHALACYAALDVIGDHAATARNLAVMRARGLDPVPTFHKGSPWSALDAVVDGSSYIALGGLMSAEGRRDFHRRETLQPYLDAVFSRLERHWPVRVHLFGVTTQWVLERYPVYSSDSASAVIGGANGILMRWQDGVAQWVHWTDHVAATWDASVAERVAGEGTEAPRLGRWGASLSSIGSLERHVTDVWRAKGVAWD